MALTNALRRAASRVVPSSARVFQVTNPGYTHHGSAVFAAVHRLSDLSNTVFERSFPSNFCHFSTRQSASDESLVKIIEEEIQCALNSDQNINQVEELPQSFPFKLQDNPGLYTVTLTREYQGETIVVEVQMPSTVTGEHADNDDDGDAGDEKGAQSELPLVVRVSKSRGPCLEFNCTAFPDDISIDSLSVRDPDISEDQIGYEGPEFTDLDENLQKAFHKYLEIRGVKPSTTNFLHEYMINKDDREYVRWLKNLKKFVEA